MTVAAQGINFHVPVLHVGESDWPIQGLHVHMGAGDVADLDGGGGAFQGHIAVKLLGAQRPGAGVQRDAGIGGHQDFIIHAPRLRIGARQQVGLDVDAIADQVVVDFDLVGSEHGTDHDELPVDGLTEIEP